MKILLLSALFSCVVPFIASTSPKVSPKLYSCQADTGHCRLFNGDVEEESLSDNSGKRKMTYYSQSVCLSICGQGSLWPYPTGTVDIKESFENFALSDLKWHIGDSEFQISGDDLSGADKEESSGVEGMLHGAIYRFHRLISDTVILKRFTSHPSSNQDSNHYNAVSVNVDVKDSTVTKISLQVDESYTLRISSDSNTGVTVELSAATFFGARHGLETLSQLISWNEESNTLAIASAVAILEDSPKYPYRGVMLDLSRHFISTASIEGTLRAMSFNKLNVLHLHLSDTASFPLALKRQPNITYYGAYSERETYTAEDFQRISEYANQLGVMLLPELDGPAHVANGFQWGQRAGLGDLVICDDPNGSDGESWKTLGLGPPSGQLNLGNQAIYPILSEIYQELFRDFFPDPPQYFHVGGDEVIVGSDESWASCYNSTAKAKDILALIEQKGLDRSDSEAFFQLWQNYTVKVAALVIEAHRDAMSVKTGKSSSDSDLKLHIWGGSGVDPDGVSYNLMTREDVTTILPPTVYTVQVWDTTDGSIVPDLLSKGYEVILSNTDYVYLDCGNAGWAHPGGYWCQPYHEWQHIYNYVADALSLWGLQETGNRNVNRDFDSRKRSYSGEGRILGSETLAWGEMIDDLNLEQKLWPRTAALAEALWGRTESKGSSWYAADPRLQQWRETMVSRGVRAEPLQTQWCKQREAYACTSNEGIPQ